MTVEFDAYETRWIRERTWHADQEFEKLPDEGVRLRLVVSPRVEVGNWILSFSEHARVVAPRSFRDRVATRLRAALAGL